MALPPVRFADPALLALVLLVPVCWGVARQVRRERHAGALTIATAAPLRGLPRTWRIRYRWLLTLLRFAAVVLLIIAFARPQVGRASARVPVQGIDIVIALDVSGSMLDPGLSAGSKLDGAKQAIKAFIARRTNDRVGLVLFESETHVSSPLTLDYKALQQLVDQAKNGLLPDGTAIGLGIATATNLLRESRAKSRVIILATDAEDNQPGLKPEAAAQIVQQLGMRLYTIGLVQQNATAATVSVDEHLLRALATPTGGFYARAATGAQLQGIFAHISALETSQIERVQYTRFAELAGFLLVPALALLVVEVLLAATVFRQAP